MNSLNSMTSDVPPADTVLPLAGLTVTVGSAAPVMAQVTMVGDIPLVYTIHLACQTIHQKAPGVFVECGVWR